MTSAPVLTLVVFAPLVGALLLALLPREPLAGVRRAALVFSLLPFALSLWMVASFRPGEADFQFVERVAWIPQFGIEYYLGVDGISVFLVLLTTFLVPLVVLASFGDIHRRVKEFFVLMLVLETGMLGALVALDLFLFYVFCEVMLVPMIFLIGV
jgi:NADH-quinone oxidoreductase subunit M